MFGLGTWEMVALAVIVLLLFGTRLPSVMRSLGQGVVEFKKGLHGEDDAKSAGNSDSPAKKIEEQPPQK